MSNLTLCFCINHYLDNLEFFRIQRIRDYASGQITRMYSTKFYLKIFIYQRRFRTRDGQENSFSVFFFFLFFSRFPDHFSLSFFPPFSFSLFSRKRKFFFFPGGKRKLFFFFQNWQGQKVEYFTVSVLVLRFSTPTPKKRMYYPTPKTVFTNTSTSNLIFLRSANSEFLSQNLVCNIFRSCLSVSDNFLNNFR